MGQQLLRLIRSYISIFIHHLWGLLPLSYSLKTQIKNIAFKKLAFLFFWTRTYQKWKEFEGNLIYYGNLTTNQNDNDRDQLRRTDYIPLIPSQKINSRSVKLISFYLPQFHTIPENDEWWGQGFTEWTNVKPAVPQFNGHYQPHLPGELGYYNLLDLPTLQRQVELAQLYAIDGFCFYFYWFNGKTLLEKPTEMFLINQTLNLSFCLCWANENWSRRWDGLDDEILISQNHSPEDDIAFIQHIAKYMQDPRYIRINSRPLLVVYRPGLLPSAKETAQRWRKWCLANGIGDIFIAYTQSFEKVNPQSYGFDAAIEFPPNLSAPPNITESVVPLNKDFACTVYDWRVLADRSFRYETSAYKLFRGVCPGWDNTPRRKQNSTVFINNRPADYHQWLVNAIADAKQRHPEERLIFINAWNEWAEGAHLEPDQKFGYAWLQATRDAIGSKTQKFIQSKRKIVVVIHDAYPHGAQLLTLHLIKVLKTEMGVQVDLVCLGDGPLQSEYARWATVHDLIGKNPRGSTAIRLAQKLFASGSRSALVNTTASGYFLDTLSRSGFTCMALIHEMIGVIDQLGMHGQAKMIAALADKIVFANRKIAASFGAVAALDPQRIIIRPQGLYKNRRNCPDRTEYRTNLRQKYGLSLDCKLILSVGFADKRKGIDLFVETGIKVIEQMPNTYFIWIGHWSQEMRIQINKRLSDFPNLKDRFIFPGFKSNTDLYYLGSDLYALTSREDPFPSVVLEAFQAHLPVVGFDDTGGADVLLDEGGGILVANENFDEFANAIYQLLNDQEQCRAMGQRGAEIIKQRFSFRHYVFDLLEIMNEGFERISVVVPNYNYAHFLTERLISILNQTYPIFEIIVIDDASTDNSVAVAEEILESQPVDYQIVVNQLNSGSVFQQWRKGVHLARGEKVWIAEADDIADIDFVENLIKGFCAENVSLVYSQSRQIDRDGKVISQNYHEYLKDISEEKWESSYFNDGMKEIIDGFSVKNAIPNVSACIFVKEPLKDVLVRFSDEIGEYRVAGDWFVYVNLLRSGNIYFCADALNSHRRHDESVTLHRFDLAELKEIAQLQNYVHENFPVTNEIKVKAQLYREFLIDYFSIRDRYADNEIEAALKYACP